MTQTHPTSEVAALVPTWGWGTTLYCPLLPPIRSSLKSVLINQEEKSFSLGI